MFTGIIEEIGTVTAVEPSGDGVRLTVRAPLAVSDAGHGDSISISGVCLTVADQGPDWFTADVMKQTLDMSTLAGVAEGREVNVERATAVHARLGGHIVQGHVDGTGTVLEVRPGEKWRVVRVSIPAAIAPLVVDKGSIAIDGISLTVSAVSPADAPEPWLEVSLIPETLSATTLGGARPGDRVNLESDILARHVRRLLAFAPTEGGSR
jgi:riboflavin synthase